jgi:hypothetical protein
MPAKLEYMLVLAELASGWFGEPTDPPARRTVCRAERISCHLPGVGLKGAPSLEGKLGVFFFGKHHDGQLAMAFRGDRARPRRGHTHRRLEAHAPQ